MPAQLRVAAPSATAEEKKTQNRAKLSFELDWQPHHQYLDNPFLPFFFFFFASLLLFQTLSLHKLALPAISFLPALWVCFAFMYAA